MLGAQGIGRVTGRERNCHSGSGSIVLGSKCAPISVVLAVGAPPQKRSLGLRHGEQSRGDASQDQNNAMDGRGLRRLFLVLRLRDGQLAEVTSVMSCSFIRMALIIGDDTLDHSR